MFFIYREKLNTSIADSWFSHKLFFRVPLENGFMKLS